MPEEALITSTQEFKKLCDALRTEPIIGLDTEFVPEYTYSPQLCLIQVSTKDEQRAIDPLAVKDVSEFWEILVEPGHEVIAHAAKEEMNFCRASSGATPEKLFDVQLAAGLVGFGFPLSYANLLYRSLGVEIASTEARTDWRARPLSSRQVDYALGDVKHLHRLREAILERLDRMGRQHWLEEENAEVLRQQEKPPVANYRRVNGSGSMTSRNLAILRELAELRDKRARHLDKPPRWVMRDDLLVELAKRKPKSLADLKKTRGLGNIKDGRWADELLEGIRRALALPDKDLPKRPPRRAATDDQMPLKILSAAMYHIAHREQVAPSLLGTNDDLQKLIDWHLKRPGATELPRLARGWRKEVCGEELTDMLEGKVSMHLVTKDREVSLVFDSARGATSETASN
ncbi:Ribonuclease D [Planctomycetes bacterium Pan216]|uniref:Ribonuclease D n=1 Tax=Kolteria novifilia TaxID=2527975 RepID=A0A518B9E1_9BACT|nr:Ribonuclease D [Planctomycetes bacterium Pan216]